MSTSLTALRPAEFLRAERRTPPRLLPLWVMALVALVGYQPGSQIWAFAALGAVALGLLVVPILGSIAPTVQAYLSLLVIVVLVAVATAWLPLVRWYITAWQDAEVTGFIAMVLLGAVTVGAATSVVWALLVAGEAVYRLVRRWRRRAPLAPDIDIEPALGRGEIWARRLVVGALCLAVAVPLPSFLFVSGLFSRPALMANASVPERLSFASTVLTWPLVTTAWLLLAALGSWLVWARTAHYARLAGLGLVAVVVAAVVWGASAFAVVPGDGGAQAFAPTVLTYCPATPYGPACSPPWLFDVPRLAVWTGEVSVWAGLLLLVVTLGYGALAIRRRGR